MGDQIQWDQETIDLMAVAEVKDFLQVMNASAKYERKFKHRRVYLEIDIVPGSLLPIQALRLGDTFVRLVKNFAKGEPAPDAEIGKGFLEYNLLLKIAGVLVAKAQKRARSKSLRWEHCKLPKEPWVALLYRRAEK